jgi:type II secretory pathway pseudopilin PulG
MTCKQKQQGGVQLVVLIIVAVLLGGAFLVLDRYAAGQKDMLAVETRGLQMITALSRYKQESGSYPDSLLKLIPKHAVQVSQCPGGEPMAYQLNGAEFQLSCEKVVFKQQTYAYDSRTRVWGS